jgi:hypothetical protein
VTVHRTQAIHAVHQRTLKTDQRCHGRCLHRVPPGPSLSRLQWVPVLRIAADLSVKCTQYFLALRTRPDRVGILDEWIQRAIEAPIREVVQADGRIRRRAQIPERNGR